MELKRKKEKRRDLNLDLLRTICAIFILTMHVIDFYILDYKTSGAQVWMFINLWESIIRFAVPVFFMISGALIIGNKKENFLDFYIKRLTKIVLPYLLISIIYSLGNQFLHTRIINLKVIINNIVNFDAHYHLWFFKSLIIVYIFVPLIRNLVKLLESKNKENLLAVILFIWSILGIILPYILNIINLDSKKYVPDIINYFGYFLLGHCIYNYYKEYLKSKRKILVLTYIISVAITLTGNYFYLDKVSGIYNNYFINPMALNIFIQANSVFIYFIIKDFKVNNIIESLVREIGMSSLYIYLFHPIFILILKSFFNYNLFSGNLYLKSILAVFIVGISTVIFSVILNRVIVNMSKKFNLKKTDDTIYTVYNTK